MEAIEKTPPVEARGQETSSPRPKSILGLIREGFDKEMKRVLSDLGKLCIGTFGTLGDGVEPDCLGTLCIRPSNDGSQKLAVVETTFNNMCLQVHCILDEHDEDPEAFREKYKVTLADDERARRPKRALEEGEYEDGRRAKILRKDATIENEGDKIGVADEDGDNGGDGSEIFIVEGLADVIITSNVDPENERGIEFIIPENAHGMEIITDYDTIEDVAEAEPEDDENYEEASTKKGKNKRSAAKRVKEDEKVAAKKNKPSTRGTVKKLKSNKRNATKAKGREASISIKDKETGIVRWEPCLRCPQCTNSDCGTCAPCTDKKQKRRCNQKKCGNMLSKAKRDKLEAWESEVAAGTAVGKVPPVEIVRTYSFTRRRCGRCLGCLGRAYKQFCGDCPECYAKNRDPSVKRHRVFSCQRCRGIPTFQ